MNSFFEILLDQVQILAIGSTLLVIRQWITGENIDDVCQLAFPNKYFTAYLFILWFAILPWFIWYFRLPRFGIWGSLFEQSPLVAYIALGIIIVFNVVMLLRKR